MAFLDQMKQLMELKQKMEEAKQRLEAIEVVSENEYVRVTANGNRKVKNVEILRQDNKTVLEGKLLSAINEVMEKAENVLQSEMMGATKGMMPDNLPGLG